MAILLLKRTSLRKWKLLIVISLLVALTAWFQFTVLRPGTYIDELQSRENVNHVTVGNSLNGSIGNASFDEVKVMLLMDDNESSRKRLSISEAAAIVENGSVDFSPVLGEMYKDGLENVRLSSILTMNMTQPSINQRSDEAMWPLQNDNSMLRNESVAIEKFVKRMRGRTVAFFEMNSMLNKFQASFIEKTSFST